MARDLRFRLLIDNSQFLAAAAQALATSKES
jgi:hypothetical protein